ncbi:MAG: 4'-phosphopantetheinyl transferase family protein [Burkholderiales bacterium]
MSLDHAWLPAPATFVLPGNEVHVWRIGLDLVPRMLSSARDILSNDEISRADRFRFDRHRDRFLSAHMALRQILGGYLSTSPAEIEFCYGPQGKPALAKPVTDLALNFNLSHADDLALVAVSHGRQLGVDIEHLRSNVEALAIARRFFSPREFAALSALSPQAREVAFFELWTRKEAYAKARGDGLTDALQFDTDSLSPPFADKGEGLRHWSLCDLAPNPGFAGAVVAQGADWMLKCWQYAWKNPS